MNKPRFFTLTALILAAALSRLVPHPWNVTPIAGMAIFAGFQFDRKSNAYLVPLAAMFLSDCFLGFHVTLPFVYLGLLFIVSLSWFLRKKKSALTVLSTSLAGSLFFFLITNFGYWLMTEAYPKSPSGLMQSYIAAIPFFRNTLLGDAAYTGLLFGAFGLAEKAIPALQYKRTARLLPSA